MTFSARTSMFTCSAHGTVPNYQYEWISQMHNSLGCRNTNTAWLMIIFLSIFVSI